MYFKFPNVLSIIKADTSHIPVIREITTQVWPQTYIPIIGPVQVTYMLDLFYAPPQLAKQMEELNHRFIICYDDEQPVAFASWSEIETNIFKLQKIYIVSGEQGKGIGKYMLGYIVSELKAAGATALRLNVNRYNFSAKAFYEKAGFEQLRDEDIDIGNGYFMNDHVLALSI